MPYYASFGAIQSELRDYYHRTGKRLQFHEAVDAMYRRGTLNTTASDTLKLPSIIDPGSMDSFDEIVEHINVPVTPSQAMSEQVREEDMFPLLRDVFIIRHPRYTRPYLHRHDYVEINCVVQGSCTLRFEDESRVLEEGSLCLIAPFSEHDIEITDESTVFCIMLRRSTFETTFFSLLSHDDVLSLFFRNILQGDKKPNYLLFRERDLRDIRLISQNAMLECHKTDSYSNTCCISYVNLLFAAFLRASGDSPEFYHYQMNSDFSLILNYIRHHYQDLTLGSLASHFHYSKPHLCTLISQNTGLSFTALIRQIRMNRACDYLINTSLHINEIAEILGYHSADHFSRVFRGNFRLSPQDYRKQHAEVKDRFIPFEMK